MDRRTFVQQSSGLSLLGVFGFPFNGTVTDIRVRKPVSDPLSRLKEEGYFEGDLSDPSNETTWAKIQVLFPRVESFCQLENGYFSHSSFAVRKLHQEREDYLQNQTSWFMRREQEQAIESSREVLASFFGWFSKNIAFTRNTTESLSTVISGFPWKTGDEVVIGDQDYGSMTEAFEQAAARWGIVLRTVKVPVSPKEPGEVTEAYLKELGPKTRMLHLTHLINLSGQIIPLEETIAACKQRYPDVCAVVDAAHSVAHIDHDWKNCKADIVAGSLHKWMCNPLGLGFLYMREEWIPEIWPLMGDRSVAKDNIRRFEHQGTRPINTIETLSSAIELNELMGGVKNKENRLRYLQESWTKEIRAKKGFQVLTPTYEGSYCAIGTVSKEGMTPGELASYLWDKHHIFTVAINHPVIKGVRVTPHLSNNIGDMDNLRKALLEL